MLPLNHKSASISLVPPSYILCNKKLGKTIEGFSLPKNRKKSFKKSKMQLHFKSEIRVFVHLIIATHEEVRGATRDVKCSCYLLIWQVTNGIKFRRSTTQIVLAWLSEVFSLIGHYFTRCLLNACV